MSKLKNRDFLKIADFSREELDYLLRLAARLKKLNKEGKEPQFLKGKNVALVFEKTSTRTRCAFETSLFDQGAHSTYLSDGSQIGKKESMADTARVLSRMYDGIEYRGFGQEIVEKLAEFSSVPVWNGLTNEAHPTQILADFLTMLEHCDKPLHEITFALPRRRPLQHGQFPHDGRGEDGHEVPFRGPPRPSRPATRSTASALPKPKSRARKSSARATWPKA